MNLQPLFDRIIFLLIILAPLQLAFAEDPFSTVWTLDRALMQVRKSNPDARSASIRIDKARVHLALARAQLWPKILAETGYAATDNPVNAFMMQLNQRQFGFGSDFNDPDTTDNWGSEVRLEYLFYTGGARTAAIDGAHLGIEASEHENLATWAQLELEVARAWFQIYQSSEIVKASLALLNNQKSNLQLARKRVDAATALQTDVLDIETKVAEAEANLVYAKNSKLIASAFLQALLGIDDATPFELSGKPSIIKEPNGQGLMRHELLALEKRKQQTETGIKLAKAERLPTVSGFASGRHDEGFTKRAAGDSWMVGVMVRLKVWGGGETKAKIQSAEKDVELAGEAYRKQKLAIQLQVTTAKFNLGTSRKRISLANKAIKSAQKSLQLTRQRFKEGLALSTQLIDSETALTSARVRLAKSQAQEQLALASLRSALGLPIREL